MYKRQLKSGADNQADGIGALESGAADLQTGISSISQGATDLEAQLQAGIDSVGAGMDAASSSIGNTASNDYTIAANLSALAGTEGLPEGVAAQLQAMADSLNSNAAGQEQIQSSLSSSSLAALSEGVSNGVAALTEGASGLSDGVSAIQTGLADSKTGALNLSAGVTDVSGGVSQLSLRFRLEPVHWHPVLHLLRPVLRPFRAALTAL